MPDAVRPSDVRDGTVHDPPNSRGDRTESRLTESFEGEIDLGRYLKPLGRYWMLLVAGALVGAIAGLTVSLRRPTLYESSTTLLVQQGGATGAISTSRALLQNYTLAAETIQETGLDKGPYRLTPQAFVETVLTVEELAGTMLLKVKARLPDPTLAAQASQVLSDKAVDLNRQVALDGNTSVRGQLKVLLDDAAARMKTAEQQLLARRSEANVEVLQKETDVLLDERGELLGLLVDIESEKSRLAAAEKEIEKQQPVLSVGRAVEAEEALRRAGRARADESRASDQRGDAETKAPVEKPRTGARKGERDTNFDVNPELLDLSNPFVNPVYQTLAYEIASTRTRLAGMERKRREISAATRAGAPRLARFKDLYAAEIEIERLQNDYDLAKKVFSDLTVRYEQSRTESVGDMVRLQVVDRAFPPDRPMPRKRVESTLLGLVVGLFSAVLLALVLGREGERADTAPARSS